MVKIKLNTVTRECIADSTFLGFEGENQANVLDFSFSDKFIDGTAVLNIKRGKDTGFVSVDKVGNGYQLPVKSSLLSQVGDVTFQFVITTVDGAIMKFDPFVMTVEDAIDTDVPLPEEYPTWVEMANVKLAEIDLAIEQANSTSKQILTDKANGVFDGKDGVDGKDGTNGVSPTVTTAQTTTGATITITDKSGTHTATLLNGKDGKDGATGADGYSPTAKVTATSTGATISITDKNGTTTANIVNGIDGKDGASGSDGKDGADGLTPYIGSNGNWWIGETDTGVSASGSGGGTGGGSSYKQVELLSEPVSYALNASINKELALLDDVTKYDEIVFNYSLDYDSGFEFYTNTEHRALVSNIVYNNSNSASNTGEAVVMPIFTSTQRFIQLWFMTPNKIFILKTTSSGTVTKYAIKITSIKGIKY